MKLNNFLALIAILSLLGCGNKSGNTDGNNQDEREENRRVLLEASPGTYYAVLRPTNFLANGYIPYGAATFKLVDDELQVSVVLDDDQAVTHRQALHLGTRCPTLADDSNGDGFVDYDEAQRVVGQTLIPLDSDLSSQAAGENIYLRGPAMTYNKIASLSKINSELVAGKKMGFEGRVVIVHGTSLQPHLPTSLASYKGEAPHLSLPIVCGILKKID